MSNYEFDPDFASILPLIPTESDLSDPGQIPEMRKQRDAMMASLRPPDRDDVLKRDLRVAGGGEGLEIALRIYTPRAEATTPRPLFYEIHGGGFLFGDIEMMDPWCQALAAHAGVVVASVDYRLAPEHPFPAGVEDCYAGLVWCHDHAAELGIDSSRMAVGGQSAGGGLAAAVALLCRDRGGPELCFQLLEIPELDDRLDTPSMRAFTDTPMWNRPNAVWSWRHYLGPEASGEVSPYAAPARATDLAGLPAAYVSTMEYDPLRDEGILYALRLMQAGVSVELHSYAGTFHGSALQAEAGVSKRNAAEVFEVVRRRLAERRP